MKDRLDAIDMYALDNAVGFAAEHTRRYIATNGADDGWEGPRAILVLYTTGRRSGSTRRNLVLYVDIGDRRFVIGSKGGAPINPAWYENLVANSRVHVRVMAEVYEATARPVGVDDRAVVWPTIVERYPMFGEYQANSDRMIPVVELVCI